MATMKMTIRAAAKRSTTRRKLGLVWWKLFELKGLQFPRESLQAIRKMFRLAVRLVVRVFHVVLDAVADPEEMCAGIVSVFRASLEWKLKGSGMFMRLAGNGMRVVAVGAVLAVGAVVSAAPMAGAQSSPIPHAHIYPDVQAAHMDIQTALAKARKEHKRVLVDFGGDWCGDCQVLNYYMHQSPNKELLEKYYVLVDVNIGHIDQNIDIGDKYGVVLKKGVPAMAVLRPDGTVVYGQKNGEFENMRNMQSSDLTTFLEAWKPQH